MDATHAIDATAQPDLPAAGMRAHGWPRALRLLGIGLAGLALAQLVTAIPQLYGAYSAICTDGCALTLNDVKALVRWGLAPGQYALTLILMLLPFTLACATVGGVIFWQSARAGTAPPFPLFVAFTLTLASLLMPTNQLHDSLFARRDLWSLAAIGMLALNQVLLTVMLTLLPDGRLTPRWLVAPLTLLTVLGVGGIFMPPLLQPASAPDLRHEQLLGVVWVFLPLFIVGVQLAKYRREADEQRRRQMRWCGGGIALIAGSEMLQQLIVLLLPHHPLVTLAITVIEALLALGLPVTIGAAVLRERLWELPVVVSRAVVYALLSASVVGLYVLLVGGLGALLHATGVPFVAALASGIVALLALPLRDRLQRAVNRFFYGERDDPYAVVARLGRQLERARPPKCASDHDRDGRARAQAALRRHQLARARRGSHRRGVWRGYGEDGEAAAALRRRAPGRAARGPARRRPRTAWCSASRRCRTTCHTSSPSSRWSTGRRRSSAPARAGLAEAPVCNSG
jgi:hypothetical protein